MSSPVGGARWDRGRDRAREFDMWVREHERDHARKESEHKDLDGRIRKLERSVWTLSAILATTTIVAIINLVRAAIGVTS